MDSDSDPSAKTHLQWSNVGIGFAFILVDVFISIVLGLQVGSSLLTASIRCILQLSVMGLVLQSVFEAKSPWAVTGVSLLLISLGTFETVVNKSKLRFIHMVPSVFCAMIASAIPVSILGTRFAMGQDPFWLPEQYIPILGMLCGSTISGIVVAVGSVLRELKENRDKIEVYLAFGASRFEACKPIAVEGLRLALLPTINQMSVIGLISIPGMMTGSILGGASVDQAAKLQMVIMFMISASTVLASIIATVFALGIVVDGEDRVRADRILSGEHGLWKARNSAIMFVVHRVSALFWGVVHRFQGRSNGGRGIQLGNGR